MAAWVERPPLVWIGLIAGLCGLIIVPVLGVGLSGRLPIKDGWLILAILMAYITIVAGGLGFVFPRSWWLSVVTARRPAWRWWEFWRLS